ncbi:MAG: hypothetical protein Q8909_09840 [Bacteroidota bacterium]|nr:hypothetical protein [Bacteroidota bacterium]
MDVITTTGNSIIKLKEHESIKDKDLQAIKDLGIPFRETAMNSAPVYLGIKPNMEASYYIGADWLTSDISVVILPKIDNIDFVKMFMCALKFDLASDYFSNIYDIDFDKKSIEYSGHKNQLTPLLIIHYLSMLKRIVKRGLKKDYVLREENLVSKVKGRILVSRNIRANILTQRYDRTYCQFQEYTEDNPENRLLKKALLFAKKFAFHLKSHASYHQLNSQINALLSHFIEVSDEIEVYEIKNISSHKIYREYSEAIRIAKMILRRFSYSIHKVDNYTESTPAFWIDMSRLYEVYVYSLLHQAYGDEIEFQVSGYRQTAVDFIKKDQKLIIDTKYKPHYSEGNRGIVDDIRQISGYARDKKILKRLLGYRFDDDFVPNCLIIYPDKEERLVDSEDEEKDKELQDGFEGKDILSEAVAIKAFSKFYKLSVLLPTV